MLISPNGVAPSRLVGVSASVNLPLHHKVQKFSSGTISPGGPGRRAVKWLWWCGSLQTRLGKYVKLMQYNTMIGTARQSKVKIHTSQHTAKS